jgi:diguanylate cyclase (GGDEF)-like protein
MMTTPASALPVHRDARVFRFLTLRPSRRVLLIAIVAIACGALLGGVALLSLRVTQDQLAELNGRVLPASAALNRTIVEAGRSEQFFLTALSSPVDQRSAIIADSQLAATRGGVSWREYQGYTYGSITERRLQRLYDRLDHASQDAGATVFALLNSPHSAAFQAALASQRALVDRLIVTASQIRDRFYLPRAQHVPNDAAGSVTRTRLWILGVLGLELTLALVLAVALFRRALAAEQVASVQEAQRHHDQRRANFERQLHRGLEMEPSEESTYDVIGAALRIVRPDQPSELLVADSSRAHFRQVLSTDPVTQGPGCPVTSPAECAAAHSGQTQVFLNSTRLDACPFLRNREGETRSAACIPLSIAGATIGVIHTTGAEDEPPDATELSEFELVARRAGDRIGFLRVLARSEMQAGVDVLTGLFNRRSVEQRATEVLEQGNEFVVAFADLDNLKDLNDKYGHETGDRALRLFGRVLRDSVRPADIPARYGGDEFVVLLPDCILADARIVADRVQDRLRAAVAIATFTVSIGLAASEPAEGFTETVARADAALLEAKRTRRNGVGASTQHPGTEPVLAALGHSGR